MKEYILVSHQIPEKVCDTLIENATNWEKHRWNDNIANTVSDPLEENDNTELDVVNSNQEEQDLLESYCVAAVKEYQERWGQMIKELSHIRFNRYQVGTSMKGHYDHIHDLFDGEKKGIPILSFVGLLNDDFEGGEFMLIREEMKLKKGDILIFPSVFLFPHEVLPITSGTRYSFVTWGF